MKNSNRNGDSSFRRIQNDVIDGYYKLIQDTDDIY